MADIDDDPRRRRPAGDGVSLGDRPTTRYVGRREGGSAVVERISDDGRASPLPMRLDLRNHSPAGFNWGYGGSGPAQLALAILADALGAEDAQALYQQFKWGVIARLDGDDWTITRADVEAWVRGRQEAE